jgi:hypothetical protein
MFLAGNIPFSFVERVEFQVYINFLCPDADLPNRRGLKPKLKQCYDSIQNELHSSLYSEMRISMAIDCWGSQNQLLFLGITCQYISDHWQLRQVLLGFEPIVRSHTG